MSKFTINYIRLVNMGLYDKSKNEDCTICRCNLNDNSLYNKEKGLESEIIIGKCGHGYHKECITPWINKHPNCPICSQKW